MSLAILIVLIELLYVDGNAIPTTLSFVDSPAKCPKGSAYMQQWKVAWLNHADCGAEGSSYEEILAKAAGRVGSPHGSRLIAQEGRSGQSAAAGTCQGSCPHASPLAVRHLDRWMNGYER